MVGNLISGLSYLITTTIKSEKIYTVAVYIRAAALAMETQHFFSKGHFT